MKKILMVAAAAGLMSLAACGGATNTVQENAIESHEDNADNYEAAAENATTPVGENELLAAEAKEENAAEAAEAKH